MSPGAFVRAAGAEGWFESSAGVDPNAMQLYLDAPMRGVDAE
jgi:hypothetical protein